MQQRSSRQPNQVRNEQLSRQLLCHIRPKKKAITIVKGRGRTMTPRLFISAVVKFCAGVILVGSLLFLPAGTLDYPNAWLFMGILFIPMFVAGIVMMVANPELLRKRLNAKEKQGDQGAIVKVIGLMFIIGFILAAIDFRFKLLPIPNEVSYVASGVFLLVYAIYAEVLRENTYLSRTIEVQEGQKIIDTGLYGIIRHPMYSATLLLFLSMPLVLGSLLSLAVFLMYPILLAKRIHSEEMLLSAELAGYDEYKEKVRYRLIPFIW